MFASWRATPPTNDLSPTTTRVRGIIVDDSSDENPEIMVTIRYERGIDREGCRIIETDTGSVYRLVPV